MTRSLGLTLTLIAGLVFAGVPLPVDLQDGRAMAAQSTTKKSTTKKTTNNKSGSNKKSYCGYPAPPLPVGMSDFCARQYDLFCRRGVGCNIYGR